MKISQSVVTPRIAKSWLLNNSLNRKVSESTVIKYSTDMKNGRWVENGETLKFNGDGTLIDGQHRLRAIIMSGTSQKMFVVRGLSKEVFPTLDTGKKRGLPDVLGIAGVEKYSVDIAALTRLIYDYERLGLGEMFSGSHSTVGTRANLALFINNQEYLDFFKKTKSISESLSTVVNLNTQKSDKLVSRSILAFSYFLFSKSDKERALEFISKLLDGDNLTKENPIYKVRERLTYHRFKRVRLGRKQLVILLIKSWNSWITGSNVSKIYLNAETKIPEVL